MEFLPFPLAYFLAGAFITLLCFVLLLNIFGLPANWLLLGLVALWKMVHPDAAALNTWFWIIMIALALIGEALELGMQILKARRYGSSSSGTFAGMIGAIAGAVLLAPLFFGLGALIGALVGRLDRLFCHGTCQKQAGQRSSGRRFRRHDGPFFGHCLQNRRGRSHACAHSPEDLAERARAFSFAAPRA